MTRPTRIELASSADTAPLFLARSDERQCWTADATEAVSFASHEAAWDFVFANVAVVVRVRS